MKTLSLFPMKTAQPPLVGSTARTCTSMTVLFTVLTVLIEGRKTSCSSRAPAPDERFARISLAPRAGMIVSGERRNAGPARTLPAVFGSLAKDNIVGKLPTIAGWQPALPGSPRHTETARDLLLVFFESTLHVPPDQQLSALQPLTK